MDAFKALKVGALKWCKEHVPKDGTTVTTGQKKDKCYWMTPSFGWIA